MKYDFSYRNELKGIQGLLNNNLYVYDSEGNRVKATVGGVSMYYPSKLYSRISSSDKTKYIYVNNSLIATVRTVDSTTTPYYIHTDHLGSTNAVSNSTGTVELLDYYSYGSDKTSTGSCDIRRKYIGEYCDNDTSLAYLNARYYNSYSGRFISQDPMFWSPERFLLDPQSLNAYSYARNNPINLIDSNGMMWSGSEWLDFAGGVVIGAGIAIGTAAVIGAVAVASPVVATVAVGALVVYGAAELGIATYESYEKNNGSIGGMASDLVSWASDNPGEVGGIVGGVAGCSLACKGATQLGAKGANKLEGIANDFISRKTPEIIGRLKGLIDPKFSPNNFFEGTSYSPKVKGQMGNMNDLRHSFPDLIKDGTSNGYVRTRVGGDGVSRLELRIPGSINGQDGNFEFIKESNGIINHRYFQPK